MKTSSGTETKVCGSCGLEKPAGDFEPRRRVCKPCRRGENNRRHRDYIIRYNLERYHRGGGIILCAARKQYLCAVCHRAIRKGERYELNARVRVNRRAHIGCRQ
jgi:hypothetical protein